MIYCEFHSVEVFPTVPSTFKPKQTVKSAPAYLLIILLGLTTIVWSGCRSTQPTDRPDTQTGPELTVSASADVVIVDKGTPRLASVQPVPGHFTISPGETISLSGIAFDQEGRELDAASIRWQVADPNVGTITPSGVFRAGFTTGTFDQALVVTARSPEGMEVGIVQAATSVTVEEFDRQLVPVNIVFFPEIVEVAATESLLLTALAVDANGVVIPDMDFKWEVLKPLAGSISGGNRLTATSNIGTFADAVKVTLIQTEEAGEVPISASLDVTVLDLENVADRIVASVLPGVISLRPGEQIRFTTLFLDSKGNQITPVEPVWEILDNQAGTIDQRGRFTAAESPEIYVDVVRVTAGLPDTNETLIATATVAIVDVSPPAAVAPESFRVEIFPARVVLSPGESTRVTIISLDGDVQFLSTANIDWSLNPPEVAAVSQFVNVTAHDFPGVYEDAIRAQVTVQTENGPVIKEVRSTLIIRDVLDSVEVTPQIATAARGDKVQFRAVARDRNGVLVPDVTFRWKVSNPEEGPAVGTIDAGGLFTVQGPPGNYPGAVQVEAVQRGR